MFFFFKQKTAYEMRISDWSSDVCSSDLVELGGDAIDRAAFDDAEIDRNAFFCPDAAAAARWEKALDAARKNGSSLGAVVECVADGVPAGWGAPLHAKLDSELAAAMMRSEEHTSELQSLMRNSYAVFCLTKKKTNKN